MFLSGWKITVQILIRYSNDAFSHPKQLQGKPLLSILLFISAVFSAFLELNPHNHLMSLQKVMLFPYPLCFGFTFLGTSFCNQFPCFFLRDVPSSTMELTPSLLPRPALTLKPPRLQDPFRGRNELCKGSHEITASSSEGEAHRHLVSADQSLYFAEMYSTYAANCE